jgi:hypothetical protein
MCWNRRDSTKYVIICGEYHETQNLCQPCMFQLVKSGQCEVREAPMGDNDEVPRVW